MDVLTSNKTLKTTINELINQLPPLPDFKGLSPHAFNEQVLSLIDSSPNVEFKVGRCRYTVKNNFISLSLLKRGINKTAKKQLEPGVIYRYTDSFEKSVRQILKRKIAKKPNLIKVDGKSGF